jgi:hypothetical protein
VTGVYTLLEDGQATEVGEAEWRQRITGALACSRPVALDREERVACLGVAARDRAEALARGHAPDFVLPDLAGRLHALSDHRGRKVLLLAWASW